MIFNSADFCWREGLIFVGGVGDREAVTANSPQTARHTLAKENFAATFPCGLESNHSWELFVILIFGDQGNCASKKSAGIFSRELVIDMSNEPVRIDEGRKKANTAAKTCRVCGEAIQYTRRAARDWDRIEYCSAVCRRTGLTHRRIAAAS
jgi:hypothetical protein